MTITVDKKGSVPVPKEVLRESGVRPGDELDISADGESIVLHKVTQQSQENLLKILRSLKGLPIPKRNRSPVRDVKV